MSNYPGSLKASAIRKMLIADGFTYERTNQHGIQLYVRTRGNERVEINLHPTRDPPGLDIRRIFAQAGWGPEGPVVPKAKISVGEQLIHKAKLAAVPDPVPSHAAATGDNPVPKESVDDDRKLEAIIFEDEHGTLATLNRFATTRTQLKRWREEVGTVDRAAAALKPAQDKPDLKVRAPVRPPFRGRPFGGVTRPPNEIRKYTKVLADLILRNESPWKLATEIRMRNEIRKIRMGEHWALEPEQAEVLRAAWSQHAGQRSPRYDTGFFKALPPARPEPVAAAPVVPPPQPKEVPMQETVISAAEVEELRTIVVEQAREIWRLKRELAAKQ